MTIIDLLHQLRAARISLELDGCDIRYTCPRGSMTEDLREAIRKHKPVLTELLHQAESISRLSKSDIYEDNLPKTPWLSWYLDTYDPQQHNWIICKAVQLPGPISAAALQASISKVLRKHDAFGLRLAPSRGKLWRLHIEPNTASPLIDRYTLSNTPNKALTNSLWSIALTLRRTLSILSGPVLRAAICSIENDKEEIILIVMHHTVVDGYSSEYVLNEIIRIYHSQEEITPSKPRSTSLSYREYLSLIASLTNQTDFIVRSLAFWITSGRLHRCQQIPRDFENGCHTSLTSRQVSITLGRLTLVQLSAVASMRGLSLNEQLLCALCQVFTKWTRNRYLYIDFEQHGRGITGLNARLTETVGPTTIKVPLIIDGHSALVNDFHSFSNEVRESIDNGLGYGFLKYCCDDPQVRYEMAKHPHARVLVNNTIGLSSTTASDTTTSQLGFNSRRIPIPPVLEKDDLISYDIMIEFSGSMNEATIRWIYSSSTHRDDTIHKLSNGLYKSIQSMLQYSMINR